MLINTKHVIYKQNNSIPHLCFVVRLQKQNKKTSGANTLNSVGITVLDEHIRENVNSWHPGC